VAGPQAAAGAHLRGGLAEGGNTVADAVEISRAFAEHGASAIDVSAAKWWRTNARRTGAATKPRSPSGSGMRWACRRLPSVAFRPRDDATSIVLAGRADLVAIGRAALHDPAWALHAAAELGYAGPGADWPEHYRAGAARPTGPRGDRLRRG